MFDILNLLFALLPILVLLVALGVFKWPAHWVTPAVAILTLILGLTIFKSPAPLALNAALEGALIALWPIMIVIVAAIYTYLVAESTGSLKIIENFLSKITTDKRLQVLILAWGFGGFLEAVAGYGTAVAIPASILIVLGFSPLFASVISLVANTVPTAFGAVGIPVSTLAQLTGLDVRLLSGLVAFQLTPFILLIPFVLVVLTGRSLKALAGVWPIALASGLSFAVVHGLTAAFLGAELPALLGSAASLVVTVWLSSRFPSELAAAPATEPPRKRDIFRAWLPYVLMFAFILVSSPLFPGLNHLLKEVRSELTLVADKPVRFYWIATPGVMILLAAVIAGLIQGAKPARLIQLFGKTLVKLAPSFVTVVSILAMARVMGTSGMITLIALTLSSATGGLYPLLAPFLGALGTFVTGSDTSSNILFGQLQTEVAQKIGLSPAWLAASNTAGATAGKMISPQSIAVAVSATDQSGQEGNILQRTLPVCLVYVVLAGILVWVLGSPDLWFFGG